MSLLALILAFLVLAAEYSRSIPLFEGQDEIWHVVFAQTIAGGALPVVPDHRETTDMFSQREAAQPPLYYALIAPLLRGTDVDTLRASALHNPHGSLGSPHVPDNRNMFAHPPGPTPADAPVRSARWVSALLGAATVLLTVLSARALAPAPPGFALLAGGLVAFLPGFLFISSLVSNDVGIAFCGALLLYLALVPRSPLLVGLGLGLAALTKTPGLLGVPLLGAAWLLRRSALAGPAVALSVAATVGGWWYARNLMLYGELTGLARHLGRRSLFDEVPTAAEILLDVPGLYQSFVGLFGWFSVPMSGAAYVGYGAVLGLGVLGWLRREPGLDRRWLLPLLWVVLVVGALVFSRLIFRSFHGRLLYPALAAFALLWAYGVLRVLPARAAPVLTVALGFAAAAVPSLYIRPAYAVPPAAQACPSDSASAVGAAPISLVSHVVSADTAAPGGVVDLSLCWRADGRTARPLSAFAQVVDATDRVLAQHDGFPGGGNDATVWWEPGSLHADRHRLILPHDAPAPLVAEVRAGFYDKASGERLRSIAPGGGDTIVLGRLRVVDASAHADASAPLGDFDNGMRVLSAALDPATLARVGGRIGMTTRESLTRDLTLSVQLVGPSGLVAQEDKPPRGGLFPTSAWRPDELVPHVFALSLPVPPPSEPMALILIAYDPVGGARVGARGSDHLRLASLCARGDAIVRCE